MSTPLLRSASLVAIALAALVPATAAAADCARAIEFATAVVESGKRAAAAQDMLEAQTVANDSRYPAIDAAQNAKACGCTEAMPILAGAARDAARANATINLTAAQQFGAAIRKQGEEAVEALRRCGAR
jgi:hypothetical protein